MVVYTKEQVEAKLKELEEHQAKAFKAKDINALGLHYHPDATLIHKGVKAYYGRDEIKEAMKPFLESGNNDSIVKPLYGEASSDGEYLIRRATFSFNGKDFPFEQIYKKVNNEYLIYHDEFEFSQ